jgi:putative two-component system response regulator
MITDSLGEVPQTYSGVMLKTPMSFPYEKKSDTASPKGLAGLCWGKNPIHFFEKQIFRSIEPAAKILIINDDPLDVEILECLPDPLPYDIFKASDGSSALSILNRLGVDLVLLDIEMAGKEGGFEFCRQLKRQEETRPIPVIFISGIIGLEQKAKGFEVGGVDFVSKPFHPEELLAKVRTHLELRQLQTKLETRVAERTAHLSRVTEKLSHNSEKLEKSMRGIIQTIALTVETRDPYTVGHQRRVAELSRAIAQAMGLPAETINGLYTAAKIHDLGKITVPAEILTKPEKLSDAEFSLIKLHPEAGYSILEDIDFPWPVARMVLEHHERINGSGYPKRLTGEDLLIESRILAVADVVEAITFFRPYRLPFGIDMALYEIEKEKGILFEAEAVDFCLRLFREKKFKWV